MEKRFETLYSALLEFQIRTALRFHERTAKTFVKETFNPNAWKELRANIDKAEALLNQDLEHVTASALLLEAKNRNDLSKQHAAALQKLLLPLGDTAAKIATTTEKQLQAEQAILTAVTEQSMFQQAEAQRKDEQKMSDEEIKCLQRLRFTDTDTYEVTKDRVDAHVEADPGCGKSKHAMDQLLRDPEGLVNTPSLLWTIFWQAVCDPEAGSIIVVMDALDECDPSDLKKSLVPDLEKNMAKSVNTKFLFTTRPYDSITLQFGCLEDVVPSYVRILGEDQCEEISKEVNLVIEHRVKEFSKRKKLNVELERKLRDMLLKIEHRTYLWVALLFDDLQDQSLKKTADGIESAIKTLPTSVNEAYEKLLSRSTEHSTVRRTLCLILGALRPLSVSEIRTALNARAGISLRSDHESDNDFKDRLRQFCGLFIGHRCGA
ncbi:hypothetical protein N0V85_007582 [Neurospora sp. IMI 360204]|nr:hypothetical protein N0V85_007582 [Neurospora sp. IMI 360204]